MGRASGICGGKGGSMHLTDVSHGAMGSYAIVGRAHADRGRSRVGGEGAGHRTGGRLLLRGRDDEHRRVPRGAQPGRRLEAPGGLRLREQPLHGVHADRAGDGGRAPGRRPGRRVRARVDRGRRQRRRRGATRSPRASIGRARDGGGPALVEAKTYRHGGHSRADPAKYRPEDEVQGVAGPRPDPRLPRTAAVRRDRRRDDRPDRPRGPREGRPGHRGGEGGPVPGRPLRSETELWADGGSAWRN